MTKLYLIYKYTSPSGKSYIGQTNNPKRRNARHKKAPKGECTNFYNAIQKYGYDNFIYELLFENLTLIEANSLEEWCIREHNTLAPIGYNLTPGGLNKSHSEETKQKIGAKSKGRPSARKGAKTSDETKIKQSIAATGRKASLETIIKLRNRKQSLETIEKRVSKIRGKPRPEHVKEIASKTHKGKIVTTETREKQAIAKRGRKLSPESIAKRQATRLARGLIKKSTLLPNIS